MAIEKLETVRARLGEVFDKMIDDVLKWDDEARDFRHKVFEECIEKGINPNTAGNICLLICGYECGRKAGEGCKRMKNPSREAVRQYCIANDLFTDGSVSQYERMFDMLDLQKPIANIATAIWLCSVTDKHAEDIENDLRALRRPEPGESEEENAES